MTPRELILMGTRVIDNRDLVGFDAPTMYDAEWSCSQ
jgi:hypothetical protein